MLPSKEFIKAFVDSYVKEVDKMYEIEKIYEIENKKSSFGDWIEGNNVACLLISGILRAEVLKLADLYSLDKDRLLQWIEDIKYEASFERKGDLETLKSNAIEVVKNFSSYLKVES